MAVQFYLTLGDRDSKLPVDIDDDECVGDGRPHIEKFYYLFFYVQAEFFHMRRMLQPVGDLMESLSLFTCSVL